MHHFLPLSEYEIMLLKVLPQQLNRSLSVLHDNFTIFVVLGCRIQVPPPSTLLKKLEEELSVVSTAYKSTIGLEQLPLEIELNRVAFIQSVKKFG